MARLLAILLCLSGAGRAGADCKTTALLARAERAVASALACERLRLHGSPTSCVPVTPPACAGSVVEDLRALAGTPGLVVSSADRRRSADALRCQRAIVRLVARYATNRLKLAAAGVRGRDADAHVARVLRRLGIECRGAVATTDAGQRMPRLGPPCDGDLASGDVDGDALAQCLATALPARLEPVVRSTVKPSIILVLTDDQPATMIGHMDTLQTAVMGDHGVSFPAAFGTTPLCAPGRASVLTGRYAQNHGVLLNTFPYGYFALDDSSTVASWLHAAGYRTGYFGKYLNGYVGQMPNGQPPTPQPYYVPPGWDDWHVFTSLDFFNYHLAENGAVRFYGSAASDYATDVLAAEVVDFIRSAGDAPFFLVFAPYATHDPATPAPRHAGRFSSVPPWRPPNYDEADVSDKARWLRYSEPLSSAEAAFVDVLYERMLESLLSVDEAIAAILQALRDAGRDADTLLAFTTDNGLSLGEHRWVGKICPYEECLRIPLVIRYPRLVDAARTETRFVANIDLAPTFAEFAGTQPATPVDGTSLAPLLDGSAAQWRSDILGEVYAVVPPPNHIVRTARYAYIEYAIVPPLGGQEAELYDLAVDPWQLSSVAGSPAYHDVQAALAARLRELDPSWIQTPP